MLTDKLREWEVGSRYAASDFQMPIYSHGERVAIVCSDAADANLIVAAPELYEWLKEAVEEIEYLRQYVSPKWRGVGTASVVLKRAREAIAKAEGN